MNGDEYRAKVQTFAHRKQRAFELDDKKRAILGSFVFNSNWAPVLTRGFTGRDIYYTAPRVFEYLWSSHLKINASPITLHCKHLERLGYLQVISVKKNRTTVGRRQVEIVEYESPIFGLTETGYAWVLSNCDPQHLVEFEDLSGDRGTNWRMRRQGYRSSLKTGDLFWSFCGLTYLRKEEQDGLEDIIRSSELVMAGS